MYALTEILLFLKPAIATHFCVSTKFHNGIELEQNESISSKLFLIKLKLDVSINWNILDFWSVNKWKQVDYWPIGQIPNNKL